MNLYGDGEVRHMSTCLLIFNWKTELENQAPGNVLQEDLDEMKPSQGKVAQRERELKHTS